MEIIDKVITDFVDNFSLKDKLFSDITNSLVENVYDYIINDKELVINNNLIAKLIFLIYNK